MSAQLPCDGAIGPSLKATGQLSPTLTPAASDGPLLVTVIVYWWTTPSPAVTVARPSLTLTARSAVGSPTAKSLNHVIPVACVLRGLRAPTDGSVQLIPSRLATMNVAALAPGSTSPARNDSVAEYVSNTTP